MTDILFFYVTTSNESEAQKIAIELINEKLIACANIFPQMKSMYRWEEKVETANECVLILKTDKAHSDRLISKVKSLHSYQTPCILAFPIEQGNQKYLSWTRKRRGKE